MQMSGSFVTSSLSLDKSIVWSRSDFASDFPTGGTEALETNTVLIFIFFIPLRQPPCDRSPATLS